MKLHLTQNYPFVPMVDAWKEKRRNFPDLDEKRAKYQIHHIQAKVLSNRKPPYSIKGGVYDVLTASSGSMYSVTNDEVAQVQRLFEEYEKIDIHPASGVALGSLLQAVEMKAVSKSDYIAVNLTGGGEKRVKKENDTYYLEPMFRFTDNEINSDVIGNKLEDILAVV